MGTDFSLVKLPYILEAFFAWINGTDVSTLGAHIDINKRFMLNCMVIAGWSHMFANCMYAFVKRRPDWPAELKQLRAL